MYKTFKIENELNISTSKITYFPALKNNLWKCNIITKCHSHFNYISKITHGILLMKRNASFPK